jgi:NTP pyrophosphatase (non-canonical NTP hydrolase)
MSARADMILDPDGHRPHGPRFGRGAFDTDDIPAQDVYQPQSENIEAVVERVSAAVEVGRVGEVTLDDYQAWSELNWKAPHGTVHSQERFRKKLAEEYKELSDEIEKALEGEQVGVEIESELGDLLWTATAITSDLGRKVKTAIMERLHLYGKGTRYVDGSTPPWVELAQRLSYSERGFSLDKVDELIAAGYVPQPSPYMFIDDDETAGRSEIDQAQMFIFYAARTIDYIAENTYDQSSITYHTDVINNDDAESVDNLIAEIYINAAYLARHLAGSSLSEVVRKNILKVSGRVDAGLIDKQDGERPEFLK